MCLIPLVLLVLFWAPAWLYQSVLTLIFLATAYEWLILMQLPTWRWQVMWWLLLVLVGLVAMYVPIKPILWAALVGWGIACWLVLRFPKSGIWFRNLPWFRIMTGLWLIVPAWVALIGLRSLPHGAVWVLLVLLLVWGADVGGYFAGRFLGKHLLAKEVSPKKTVEGLVGGIILALIAGVVIIAILEPQWLKEPLLWLVLLASILISVLGDLTESMFKRIQGVKDSSHILPGHGGLLDRLDSLLAAAPLFVIGLGLLMAL